MKYIKNLYKRKKLSKGTGLFDNYLFFSCNIFNSLEHFLQTSLPLYSIKSSVLPQKTQLGSYFFRMIEESSTQISIGSFSIILKNNFFVKSVYKYINKLINKDILINEIKIFLNSKVGKKYKKDLNILLENIENKDKSLEDLIINNENEYERIFDLTIHNKTYIDIANNMSALELMLLITSYIFVPFTPNIDQDGFNDLVNVAKNYDNALENIWRLGMNYDRKGYNFDLLDNFFVDSKNVYYLGEYISIIHQINQEKIVNTIVKTKDKEFIKQILENDIIVDNLDEKYKNILESNI